MDNNALLMLAGGAKKVESTIGVAGGQGFGVGVYPGSKSDLTAMGLSPMQGCEDPTHANYGNYQHTNGSIMVFVPAFCYRIGNAAAPSYSRDKENALEIRDAALGEGGGWILHRAFIDGGVQKSGFFIDKYICSKDASGKNAVSVKNGDQISLSNSYANSSSMPNCTGSLWDAITLGRARGEHYSCATCFQWAAISMLSLAHGQAVANNQFCAWYDGSYSKNYPKGCNIGSRVDYDETSLTWTVHSKSSLFGKTGSCSTFAKSTHNGQNCGIADVNGCMRQTLIGWDNPTGKTIWVMKESFAAHDMTKDNYKTQANYDVVSIGSGDGTYYWGSNAFYSDASGANRALCGVIPKTLQSSGTNTFGKDYCYLSCNVGSALCGGGLYYEGSDAGVWFRDGYRNWLEYSGDYSFRAAGYAK